MFLGVGWGNNVHVLAHSHDDLDVTPRHVHLHVRTYVMLRWRCVTSRRGGLGWGNNVHVLAHSHDVKGFDCISRMHSGQKRTVVCSDGAKCYPGLTSANKLIHFACSHRKKQFVKKIRRHAGKPFWVHTGTFDLAYDQSQCSWSVDILPRKRTKIEWPHLDVRSHMAVAMGGKCSWKSPVGGNRCVLSEDVEITGKNGCRWAFGHADFPKGTFFALRHVNYIQ